MTSCHDYFTPGEFCHAIPVVLPRDEALMLAAFYLEDAKAPGVRVESEFHQGAKTTYVVHVCPASDVGRVLIAVAQHLKDCGVIAKEDIIDEAYAALRESDYYEYDCPPVDYPDPDDDFWDEDDDDDLFEDDDAKCCVEKDAADLTEAELAELSARTASATTLITP